MIKNNGVETIKKQRGCTPGKNTKLLIKPKIVNKHPKPIESLFALILLSLFIFVTINAPKNEPIV
jgi:hypothetical protein